MERSGNQKSASNQAIQDAPIHSFNTYTLKDGRTVPIERTNPLGIVHHAMERVHAFAGLLEESGRMAAAETSLLREIVSAAENEMTASFRFMERRIGEMHLLLAGQNDAGILPGAKLDAELLDQGARKLRSKEEAIAIREAIAERGEEALKRIRAIHDFVAPAFLAGGAEEGKAGCRPGMLRRLVRSLFHEEVER